MARAILPGLPALPAALAWPGLPLWHMSTVKFGGYVSMEIDRKHNQPTRERTHQVDTLYTAIMAIGGLALLPLALTIVGGIVRLRRARRRAAMHSRFADRVGY